MSDSPMTVPGCCANLVRETETSDIVERLPPSCLVCGQLPEEVAISHAELPGIVVCAKCRDGATALDAAIAKAKREENEKSLNWAVDRWNREVLNRPTVNVHRRSLDDTWRQVIRQLGGDPDVLLALPDHDTLVRLMADELKGGEQ